MLNRLLSKNRVFMALVLAVVFVASGLLYLNTVNRQATRDIQRTQERVNAPKPPPPGETAESGHWHGDEWHAEPHEPIEVSEGQVSQSSTPTERTQVQGEHDGLVPINGQIAPLMPAVSPPTQEDIDINRAWREWSKKHNELNEQFLQASRKDIELLPTTKEEQERFDNDPEWQRRYNEALHKTAKIYEMIEAHEKENPLLQESK
ncbi:MAG: hypothetical protein OXN25_11250 [Candidatus Poribacteria bacterium]|nr:hypothetical protein [Candidatus Poribacteria bacterium]